MNSLLARILLSMMVFPLGILVCVMTMAALMSTRRSSNISEVTAIYFSITATGGFVVIYWIGIWRKAVVWSVERRTRTFLTGLGALIVGALVGTLSGALTRETDFGVVFGGITAIVSWLVLTILVWKETAGERAERVRQSAGDVLFCPRCGYNLTGLYEARCPECGAQFTLNQLYSAQQNRHELADATSAKEQ